MKLTIFGATSATRELLVGQVLREEHAVTAFVRATAKLGVLHEKMEAAGH